MQGGWTSLHRAASNGHTTIVEMLLERGAAIDRTAGVRSHVHFNAPLYLCVTLFGVVCCTFKDQQSVHFCLVVLSNTVEYK